ncbi:CAZyme family GH18 [Paecilomyces variotii]|nr:CAZyme family GH18 [Paecilomyces variotii]
MAAVAPVPRNQNALVVVVAPVATVGLARISAAMVYAYRLAMQWRNVGVPYAAVANTTCPLNVCCSKYGFCGTSEDFCGGGCQSNCEPVPEPSCSGESSSAVYIGYYEAWNYQHLCDVLLPSNIDVTPWTHLYYAFAGIDSKTFEIKTMYPNDEKNMADFVALKKKKSTLKTYISVGGWDLGGQIFSDMVSSSGNRSKFIKSAISFMKKHGFDGIDIDWEYPAASDRGGNSADTKNYVSFLKELKEACGKTYGITATLPSSYWYLQGFDVTSMANYVDYFNFMSYDIHGTWDGNSKYTSSVVNPHTNLTEITQGLDLLWRSKIDPRKVLLGLGLYGRSFTLNNTNCNTPGCPFDKSAYGSGGGAPGQCTQTSGILSDYEINRILEDYEPAIKYDETAGVNWITWNDNQWVSFDNAKTLKQKADFANGKCLGGLFSWALDLGGPGSLGNPNDLDSVDTSMDGANTEGGSDGTGDFLVGQEIFGPHDNTVTGVGPINVIFPPSTLKSPTTLHPGPFITPLEIAFPETTTITEDGTVTVTTTITRIIETTTIPLSPITVGVIPWWNWNITSHNQTGGSTVLFPSIEIGSIVISDDLQALNISTASHTPTSNRTILVPPWPWSTTPLSTTVPVGPTVHFTQGSPPGPKCTAGCGKKCTTFCDSPCMDDCDVGGGKSSGFDDPSDPDPPHKHKCGGPDFSCSGPNCQDGLCKGKGCTNGDSECQEKEVGICTEFVYSVPDTVRSTSITKTSTSCDTITACSVTATTTTTTFTDDPHASMPFIAYIDDTNTAFMASVASEIDAAFKSAEASWITTTSSSTSKSTSSETTSSEISTSTGPSATSLSNTSPEEVSYTCSGMSGECKIFSHLRQFCDEAKSYIRGTEIYGTTKANSNTGECYTDGKNAGFGCGVFVSGDGCQILGTTMQAAYDHLMDKTGGNCSTCGQVTFSNGCKMRVDYVSGCQTENNGPAQFVASNDSSATTAMSPATLASSQPSLAEIPWSATTSG